MSRWSWLMGVILLLIPLRVSADEGSLRASMIQWDWYFRESLQAIDDWEAILAAREKEQGRNSLNPIYPVPADGSPVTWFNPIPLTLLPPDERTREVRLRADGAAWAIERSSGAQGDRTTLERSSAEAGRLVQGYKHPGGGGSSQWYHRYDRRFDQLTHLLPKSAPFALEVVAESDCHFGGNRFLLRLRNVTAEPLHLAFAGEVATRERSNSPAVLTTDSLSLPKTSTLAAHGAEEIPVDFDLPGPGGGLVTVTIRTPAEAYWIPLLTYVENVPAVLAGIRQILDDTPDDTAERLWAGGQAAVDDCLRDRARARSDQWRALFARASALRDELLLRRIDFDSLLFVKRKPFYSEQPFMDAHHCYNRPGGAIFRLAPVRPDGNVTPVVDSLGLGIYRDLCLHWSAERLVFAFGNGSDRVARTTNNALQVPDGKADYDLFELDLPSGAVRQLTSTPANDCEPFYLPDGRIGFTSDRSRHIVMCGSDIHAANLFAMRADGSGVQQLSHNVFNDFNPSLLPDGRILYNRWEYNERSVTSLHNLFTMHPDGSHVAPYYGNATYRPNVIMYPRAVPDSTQVMALFTGHHGQTHGPLGLIDVRRGVDGEEPLTLLTPGVPVIGEKIEDSRLGWYSDPQPLSESTYLCSFTPTVQPWLEETWGLYVGDRHGNLALVYRDAEISCFEPVPLIRRPQPRVIPSNRTSQSAEDTDTARLLLIDVYEGLPQIPRGAAAALRILEDVPRKDVPTGGVICTSGTQIYTIKRIFGTVPIEADGSAYFEVPANRNVYFEVLDGNGLEIQRMRSVVCLQPQEERTCVGCHESRTSAPLTTQASAFHRAPDTPSPPPWGTEILSYLRDVQPVLNDRCVRCHAYDRLSNGVILTDDLTDQFVVGYEELLPYLSVANAMRWDHPDDVYGQPPYTYGSGASELVKLLRAGHYEVQLNADEWERVTTWIDANAVYYDRYEVNENNRQIFTGSFRKELESVYARRCASCHGENDTGRHSTWWLSINRRDVARSRALAAPLSRSAGGWQRCGSAVFADTSDPDYQRMKMTLVRLGESLAANPRADLLSIAGTPAERQEYSWPEPAPPAADSSGDSSAGASWVYLSSLPWEKASAGWSRNQDGLPRRDKDIEDRPLRLASRIYRKGIGTHAPSEIAYSLGGQFARFSAVIGGAEVNGTVVFQVYGDDKLLFDSGVLRGLRDVKRVDVSLPGVQQLRLVVTDAGDGYFSDEANWADARLEKVSP